MANPKLKDPVDVDKEEQEVQAAQVEMESFDPANLKLDEIGAIPVTAERTPHPFEGYPLGRKIEVSEGVKISSTFVVILKDKNIFQDPSGKGITHQVIQKGSDGNDVKKVTAEGKFLPPKIATTKVIDLKTYHNRIASDYDGGGAQPMNWVFDRSVMVDDREMNCCVVPSHSARAQICFMLDKKGKLRVDGRYLLADTKQANRLRGVFRNVNYQQLAGERAAQKFDADPSDQDRQE